MKYKSAPTFRSEVLEELIDRSSLCDFDHKSVKHKRETKTKTSDAIEAQSSPTSIILDEGEKSTSPKPNGHTQSTTESDVNASQNSQAQPCGFSARANDPEILSKVNKPQPDGLGACIPAILLPTVAVFVYMLISKKLNFIDAAFIGLCGSLFVCAFCLAILTLKANNSSYEGYVIKKKIFQKNVDVAIVTVYRTFVKTTDGRHITIVEDEDSNLAYQYLDVDDHFFFHAGFNFPFEKYDKTADGYVYCAVCCEKNDLKNDRCEKCGAPLLK